AEPRIPKSYTSEQLRNNVSVMAAGFNHDETKILTTNSSSGILNVHEINIADTVSTPLTSSQDESFFAETYLPGGNRFIYSSDKGGDENGHLFLMSPGTTEAKDLTPWENSKNEFGGWSVDKKSMYVSSNK